MMQQWRGRVSLAVSLLGLACGSATPSQQSTADTGSTTGATTADSTGSTTSATTGATTGATTSATTGVTTGTTAGSTTSSTPLCIDGDGDGYGIDCVSGTDCDDSDIDHWADCGGGCTDGDSDGRGAGCDQGEDCDDANAAVWSDDLCSTCVDADGDTHFGACDEQPASGLDCDDDPTTGANKYQLVALYTDMDDDGYSLEADGAGVMTCIGASPPAHKIDTTLGRDCNDDDPLLTAVCPAVLLQDINPGKTDAIPIEGSSSSQFTRSGSLVFFTADDRRNGKELWVTNRTPAGTHLVKDINPGVPGSDPSNLFDVNGRLYFVANAPGYGRELWTSDGTSEGTHLVKDMNGTPSDSPANWGSFTALNNRLFFISGGVMWRSDGVRCPDFGACSGTAPIIKNGTSTPIPAASRAVTLGNNAYWSGADGNFTGNGNSSVQLWMATTTSNATQASGGIDGGVYGRPWGITPKRFGNKIMAHVVQNYHDAGNGNVYTVRHSIRATDGSTGITNVLAFVDDPNGWYSGYIDYTTVVGSRYVYAIAHRSHTTTDQWFELYSTNGSTPAILMQSVTGDFNTSTLTDYVSSAGSTYFLTHDKNTGTNGLITHKIWQLSNANVLANVGIFAMNAASYPNPVTTLRAVGTSLFFLAPRSTQLSEPEQALWRTRNGASALVPLHGTSCEPTPNTPIQDMVSVGNTLYFTVQVVGKGRELCGCTDTGTPALLNDLNPGVGESTPTAFTPIAITRLVLPSGSRTSHYLFFSANDGYHGTEPRMIDQDAGLTATLLADVNTSLDSSNPTGWVDVAGTMGFVADNGKQYTTNGFPNLELWSSNGVTTGWVKEINPLHAASPNSFAVFSGSIYMAADDDVVGSELWQSDLTSAGTTLQANIYTGGNPANSSSPSGFTAFGSKIYFSAANGNVQNRELWSFTPGNAPTLLKDLDTSTSSAGSNPTQFTLFDGKLYFVASTAAAGSELWSTDGTAGATVMDNSGFVTGTLGSNPNNLTVSGDDLFFAATTPSAGNEIFRRHIGVDNTYNLVDVHPGSGGSDPTPLMATSTAGLFFFTATGGATRELHRLYWNGSTTTIAAVPAATGPPVVADGQVVVVGSKVLFVASREPEGAELWLADATTTVPNAMLVRDIYPGKTSSAITSLFLVPGTNLILFAASDGEHGVELWRSDGTLGGTKMVRDLAPGPSSSNPESFGFLDGVEPKVFFNTDDETVGREPWVVKVADL